MENVEDYRYLKEQLRRLPGDVEMIVTLGNHDIKSNFHIGWWRYSGALRAAI